MEKKYIIELLDDCQSEFKGIIVFGLTPNGQISAEPIPVEDLPPYTEPDLEQVRKEAYEEGKKQAKVQAELDVCHDIERVAKENYKTGLTDAWEAARKIVTMPDRDFINSDILDLDPGESIFTKYTAAEAIEKIRQYEQEQEKIKVGDEVGYYGVADEDGNVNYSGVVLEIRKDDYLVMEKDGKTYQLKKKLVMSKTGRHFPEIAAVLEKM